MNAPARRSLGRYRLVRELGRGGEATVHLAEDPVLRRLVAVKVFPGAAAIEGSVHAEGFRREVEVLSRLDHPGICTIHDAGVDDGLPYIAMSYVEGRTLAGRAPIAEREAVALLAPVAEIIGTAHAAGVTHGDLKPANILVTPDRRCVVLDFGVARYLHEAAAAPAGGRMAGTLPYLAPECLTRPPDPRSDVYGLGASLFELVTGRTPFVAPTRAALVRLIGEEDAPLARSVAPAVSRDLEAVLAKALDRDPAQRHQNASELRSDLLALLSGDRVSARRYGPLGHFRRWTRRRPAATILSAFAVVFLAATAWMAVTRNRDLAGYLASARKEAIRAESEAGVSARLLAWHERLADRRRLEELEERARRLVPPAPAIVPDLERWIQQAAGLLGRLDEHRSELAEVRARGTKTPGAPPGAAGALGREIADLTARRTRLDAEALRRVDALVAKLEAPGPPAGAWSWDSEDDAWRAATLSQLVEALERFGDPVTGTVAEVSKRLADARRLAESLESSRDAWSRACRSIANREECPRYDGLVISPQLGLVPLWKDRDSGLWEFLHLASGEAPAAAGGAAAIEPSTGIVLVLLPGGVARMGAVRPEGPGGRARPHADPDATPQESPLDDVPLDPFFLSKFEMTEAQWRRAGGRTRAGVQRPGDAAAPAVLVAWTEAGEALRRIGLLLPTEAQWEYAARAGTATPWWTGAEPATLEGAEVFATDRPARVGTLRANPFGLHDVAGNVSEWCCDVFARYEDPRAAGTGRRSGLDEVEHRIRRGGSFTSPPFELRSSRRNIESPAARMFDLGVRPARRVDP
jgi:formylglycine-generating enzyme required for sulfatase activity/tRNA A-37 threonylcarbamoyl transferase component Bud32